MFWIFHPFLQQIGMGFSLDLCGKRKYMKPGYGGLLRPTCGPEQKDWLSTVIIIL
jgi:hypothetical protein